MSLNEKQLLSIPLLVAGHRSCDVAKELGIAPQTISEWKKNPEYLAALNSAKQECLDVALDKLRSVAGEAATGLIELSRSAENEEVRRKATMDLFELLGIKNPEKGTFGRGIGPKNVHDAEKHIKKLENPGLAALLGDFI